MSEELKLEQRHFDALWELRHSASTLLSNEHEKAFDEIPSICYWQQAAIDQLRQQVTGLTVFNDKQRAQLSYYLAVETERDQLRQRVANLEIVQNAAMGVSGRIKRWAADLGRNASDETGELEYVEQAIDGLRQRVAEQDEAYAHLLKTADEAARNYQERISELENKLDAARQVFIEYNGVEATTLEPGDFTDIIAALKATPQPVPAAQGVDNSWLPIEEAPK